MIPPPLYKLLKKEEFRFYRWNGKEFINEIDKIEETVLEFLNYHQQYIYASGSIGYKVIEEIKQHITKTRRKK